MESKQPQAQTHFTQARGQTVSGEKKQEVAPFFATFASFPLNHLLFGGLLVVDP